MGASNKPSWAFDIADSSPRSKSTIQNYHIPYPLSLTDEGATGQRFICARSFLVLVNILFFVIGIAAIIISITVAAKPEKCEVCHSVLNPLIVFGLVTSFTATLGIYGALSNSYKTLLAYVTFVAFFFMVQMVIFFWSLFGRANFQRRMHTMFRYKMHHQPHQLTELLNVLQQRLPCCGVDGPLDYHSAGLQLPLSCCSSSSGDQCTIQTQPPASSTPLPATNATEAAESTVTTELSTVSTNITASPVMAPPAMQLSEAEAETSAEERTSAEAEETSNSTAETSTKAANMSTKTTQMSTKAVRMSTKGEKMSTKVEDASAKNEKTSPKAEETSTNAGKISTKAGIKSVKGGKTTLKSSEGTSTSTEETWTETEEPWLEDEETTSEPETRSPTKGRRKRSVTDPTDVTAGTTETAPGNSSLLPLNATEDLTANSTVNGTSGVPPPELFNNRTNLTGGPEPWDIHHVKT